MTFIRVDHADYPEVWIQAEGINTMYVVIHNGQARTHLRLDDGSVVITPTIPREILDRIAETQTATPDWITHYAPGKEENLT